MRVREEQKAGVLAWIEKWRPRLFLHHYTIIPIWRTKPHRDDDPALETRAMAISDDAGLMAHIEFFPAFWRLDSEMQERSTLHEMIHIVAPTATEGEVNQLTESFWRLAAPKPVPCAVDEIPQGC